MKDDYYDSIIESICAFMQSSLQCAQEYYVAEQFDTLGHQAQVEQIGKKISDFNDHKSCLESLFQQLHAKTEEKNRFRKWRVKKLQRCEDEIATLQAQIREEKKEICAMLADQNDHPEELQKKIDEKINLLNGQKAHLADEIDENERIKVRCGSGHLFGQVEKLLDIKNQIDSMDHAELQQLIPRIVIMFADQRDEIMKENQDVVLKNRKLYTVNQLQSILGIEQKEREIKKATSARLGERDKQPIKPSASDRIDGQGWDPLF